MVLVLVESNAGQACGLGSLGEWVAALAALIAVVASIAIAGYVRRGERRAIVARLHGFLVGGEVADARHYLGSIVYGNGPHSGRTVCSGHDSDEVAKTYFVLLWALDHIGATALEVQGGRHRFARLQGNGRRRFSWFGSRKYRSPWTEAWNVVGQHMEEIQRLVEVTRRARARENAPFSDTDFYFKAASAIAIANQDVENEATFCTIKDVPEGLLLGGLAADEQERMVARAVRNLR